MISQVNRSNTQALASGKGPSLADRVLDIARQHIGFHEGAGNANPFSRSFGRPGEPWCADFVSYCFTKAGKPLNFANTDAMMNHLKSVGGWHTGNPKPGDIVLFDWNRGDRDPSEHVGLVEKVYQKGGQTYVQTIEGNSSDQVKRNTYPINSSSLVGYGTLTGKPTPGGTPTKPGGTPTKPGGTSTSSGRPTLREGSHGAEVAKLQRSLKAAGFNPGPVDGAFGPKTEAAVKSFQRAKGLEVDGVVGPRTKAALDKFEAPAKPTKPTEPKPTTPTGPIGKIPKTGNAFIDRVADDAIKSQRQTGVPASVTMAQAILESGWGKSGLARDANNFFGIKGEGPAGHVTMRTREVINGRDVYVNANFRKYHSPAESFADHGRFLRENKRYANAFKYTNDPHRFAKEIHKAGYATDPKYASMLSSIINQYGLERFDRIARG